jgi:hypothetical protein
MKDNHNDYARDLAEIRSMMERSSKFLSLSGWEGVLAGLYALAGAYLAHAVYGFKPDRPFYDYLAMQGSGDAMMVVGIAGFVLVLALVTALFFASRKASKQGEKAWNPTSKRLLISMSVPLLSGGVVILFLVREGLLGLVAPLMLLFYGHSLYNAGKFTITEVKILGFVQIALGIINMAFLGQGLLFWAIGFGVMHIVYGIIMHIRYER